MQREQGSTRPASIAGDGAGVVLDWASQPEVARKGWSVARRSCHRNGPWFTSHCAPAAARHLCLCGGGRGSLGSVRRLRRQLPTLDNVPPGGMGGAGTPAHFLQERRVPAPASPRRT